MAAQSKYQPFLDTTVPKLTSNNFEYFDLDLQGAARRQVGPSGILLD